MSNNCSCCLPCSTESLSASMFLVTPAYVPTPVSDSCCNTNIALQLEVDKVKIAKTNYVYDPCCELTAQNNLAVALAKAQSSIMTPTPPYLFPFKPSLRGF